jgi:hypothetical protein
MKENFECTRNANLNDPVRSGHILGNVEINSKAQFRVNRTLVGLDVDFLHVDTDLERDSPTRISKLQVQIREDTFFSEYACLLVRFLPPSSDNALRNVDQRVETTQLTPTPKATGNSDRHDHNWVLNLKTCLHTIPSVVGISCSFLRGLYLHICD